MPNKQPQQRMTLEDYRSRLHQYPANYLSCKDIRHRWTLVEDFHRQPGGRVVRILECDRCGTVRTDNYAMLAGKRLARAGASYAYPENFSVRGLPQAENLSEVLRYEAYMRSLAQTAAGTDRMAE
jgi:hypothetical protein